MQQTPPEEVEAERKAHFCLALGIAPSEYDALTETEVAAFIREHNRLHPPTA